MQITKKQLFVLALPFFLLLTTGCEIKFTSDRGVLISQDFGETWEQKTKGYTEKRKIKDILSKEGITCLEIDPQDPKRIYLGTKSKGIFLSEEMGENWKNLFDKIKRIEDIAIDPKVSEIIYFASGRKIYKSTNRGESWTNIYTEPQKKARITSLGLDFAEPNNLYATTSLGILKSENYGNTWKVLKWIEGGAKEIYFYPADSKKFYVVSNREGIFKTTNGGKDWTQIKKSLKKFKDGIKINDLWLGRDKEIFLATSYGLLKSGDEGQTFEEIKTLIKSSDSGISEIGVDPKNSQEIYFTAKNTFYKSIDGGNNWTMRSLPTSRSINLLVIDPKEPRRIYLGVE